jgi:hypothetical protein
MDYKIYKLVYLSTHDFVAVVVTWTLAITCQWYTLQNHMAHVSILILIAILDYDIKINIIIAYWYQFARKHNVALAENQVINVYCHNF